jgi:hypothetical protein
MKVIDLLNKIANGEEVPRKIKFHDQYYQLIDSVYGGYKDYISTLTDKYLFDDKWNLTGNLNEEVEIIEEDKKIEKIDVNHLQTIKKWKRAKVLGNKINEIIDKINKLETK